MRPHHLSFRRRRRTELSFTRSVWYPARAEFITAPPSNDRWRYAASFLPQVASARRMTAAAAARYRTRATSRAENDERSRSSHVPDSLLRLSRQRDPDRGG